MNKKSFFMGVVTGIVLTFVGLFVYGLLKQNSVSNDAIQYLEKPVSYENKKTTSVSNTYTKTMLGPQTLTKPKKKANQPPTSSMLSAKSMVTIS